MVQKQRQQQRETVDDKSNPTENPIDQDQVVRQKVLESRIEKLRKMESKVNRDMICSKKTCPTSIDPRTTQERSGKYQKPNKNEFQSQIARYRSQQRTQSALQDSKYRNSREGRFKLRDEEKSIQPTATDEVSFNFMRRHQVIEEATDMALSDLI